MQYGALLKPIIENQIRKQMQTVSTRMALLLVRVAFASEQTRSLVTNVLGRMQGITPETLNEILDRSAQAAKGKITYQSPQLEEIIEEVQQWFKEKDLKKPN